MNSNSTSQNIKTNGTSPSLLSNGARSERNLFDEPLRELEHVYKTYLELANYKVKDLLTKQFKRDLFFQIGLGVALLGILFLSAAAVYFLEPFVSPGIVLVFLAILSGVAAYLSIHKAFFKDSTSSSEDQELEMDDDRQRIEDNISLATKRLSVALDHSEEKALERINPVHYVSEKVKRNPGTSLGIAIALGLSTLLSREDDGPKR